MDGGRVLVHRASLSGEHVAQGTIAPRDGAPTLGLAEGSITLDVVQPAGKAAMTGASWLNGRRGVGGYLERSGE